MHKKTLFTRGWKLVSIAILASILLSLLGNVLAEPNDTSDTSDPWSESEPFEPGEPGVSEGDTTSDPLPDTPSDPPSEPEVFTEGDFRYTVDEGNATVKRYIGEGGDVVVPETLGGYPVTQIGKQSFIERQSVTSVVLPDSVVTIGEDAFFDCIGMTSIKLSSNLAVIEDGAFTSCVKLLELELPDSLRSIGSMFLFMSGVQSIFIPKGVTFIRGMAFMVFNPDEAPEDVLEQLAPYIPETQLTDIYFEVESPLDTWDPLWNGECTAEFHWGTPHPNQPDTPDEPEHEHTYTNWESDGDETHTGRCECGETLTLPHDWDSGVVTKPATHTEEGVKTYTCDTCSGTKTEKIPKLVEEEPDDNVLTDEDSDVSVEFPEDKSEYYAGATLTAEKQETGDSYDTAKGALSAMYSQFVPYDISLTDAAGEALPVSGKITVSVPVPDGWKAANTAVYYVSENGKAERISCKPSADGNAVEFETDHFSIYTLVNLASSVRILGDVDGKNGVDAYDYMMLKRHVLRTFKLPDEQKAVADVNKSGDIDANDYMMVKRHVLRTFKLPTA